MMTQRQARRVVSGELIGEHGSMSSSSRPRSAPRRSAPCTDSAGRWSSGDGGAMSFPPAFVTSILGSLGSWSAWDISWRSGALVDAGQVRADVLLVAKRDGRALPPGCTAASSPSSRAGLTSPPGPAIMADGRRRGGTRPFRLLGPFRRLEGGRISRRRLPQGEESPRGLRPGTDRRRRAGPEDPRDLRRARAQGSREAARLAIPRRCRANHPGVRRLRDAVAPRMWGRGYPGGHGPG